jgi:hypothetical protein
VNELCTILKVEEQFGEEPTGFEPPSYKASLTELLSGQCVMGTVV